MAPETVPPPTILVADAPSPKTKTLLAFLAERSYRVLHAKDGETAFNILDSEPVVHAMIAELHVHRINGMRLLEVARARNPEICAVIITQDADIERATEAIRQGAYDFQTKPLNLDKLIAVIERGLSHQELVNEVHKLHRELDQRYGFDRIVGNTPRMVAIYERLRQIAPTRTTVLVTGPTGAGKDLVAHAIHANSPRRGEVFVKVNCAALAESVIESELFGHEAGAFTGAARRRKGRFEYADGGTLFLDEVGELSPATQAKLLRVLEERTFERLGSNTPLSVDVRVIAATNRDLRAEVDAGRFREDLYYRLAVAEIQVPALHERVADIPLLAKTFLEELGREHGRRLGGISRGALEILCRYDWPGNVRELRNVLENFVVFARDGAVLHADDLPPTMRDAPAPELMTTFQIPIGATMDEAERTIIEKTLAAVGGNRERAAAVLGIGVRTLYRKLRRYEAERGDAVFAGAAWTVASVDAR